MDCRGCDVRLVGGAMVWPLALWADLPPLAEPAGLATARDHFRSVAPPSSYPTPGLNLDRPLAGPGSETPDRRDTRRPSMCCFQAMGGPRPPRGLPRSPAGADTCRRATVARSAPTCRRRTRGPHGEHRGRRRPPHGEGKAGAAARCLRSQFPSPAAQLTSEHVNRLANTPTRGRAHVGVIFPIPQSSDTQPANWL